MDTLFHYDRAIPWARFIAQRKCRLTKRQALVYFRRRWNRAVMKNPKLRGDITAKREAWYIYFNALAEAGCISQKSFAIWTNPFKEKRSKAK